MTLLHVSIIKALGAILLLSSRHLGVVTSDSSSEGNRPTHRCNGDGQRFCGNAHEVTRCPRKCQPGQCLNGRPRTRLQKRYENIIMSGKYDFVYHINSKNSICIAHCKGEWGKMTCQQDWERLRVNGENEKYCRMIDCARVGKKIEGCHHPRKDFIQPTCAMCHRLFPKACAPTTSSQLRQDRSSESSSEASSSNSGRSEGVPDSDIKLLPNVASKILGTSYTSLNNTYAIKPPSNTAISTLGSGKFVGASGNASNLEQVPVNHTSMGSSKGASATAQATSKSKQDWRTRWPNAQQKKWL